MSSVAEIASGLRDGFDAGITRPRRWRHQQLLNLRRMLVEHRQDFEEALRVDLGKHPTESVVTEIGILMHEIDHALGRLRRWMRSRAVPIPLVLAPARGRTVPEPLGVVLIIGPWNYPLQLVLNPLIGALAAGNATIVKPSELAAATSRLLAELLPQHLDRRAVAVVEGGADTTQELLAQRLDHIFFTGSEQVGTIVATAAARTLTPVTLELGGKSPVYLDSTVDLAVAARRIMWAKLLNAGQTCVAPDYLLTDRETARSLLPHLEQAAREMYGDHPAQSPDYGMIVTSRHAERLARMLEGEQPAFGGTVSVPERYVAPTVVDGVSASSPLMQEEIFGPILPIVHVGSAAEARAFIRSRPKPLAAYVFSRRRRVRRAFLTETSSGALGFGAPAAHLSAPELPFGGVGASGLGTYHGRRSFLTFGHVKAVFDKPLHPDTMRLAYPPYGGPVKALLTWLMMRGHRRRSQHR